MFGLGVVLFVIAFEVAGIRVLLGCPLRILSGVGAFSIVVVVCDLALGEIFS